MRERQDRADKLLALLAAGPKTWRDLALAGLSGDEAAVAGRDIALRGQHRVRFGAYLIELEPVEGDAP